ncbi:HalOD1 output domain-containing protein [Halosimplex marinum]|uniref:HalOD1 output domain-containing protein n=1 Tax=Halosimplex marinum TaxID=3396620 RepID=UPI003F57CEB5
MTRDWTVRNAYGDDAPSRAVVQSVAAATNRAVDDLDPLYGAVDPDALDALFDRGGRATVSFRYAGCDVTVTQLHVVVRSDGAAAPSDGDPAEDTERTSDS